MTDVRLTAVNPEDSQVYPVACNDKGELLLDSGGASGDLDVTGNLTVAGSASFAGGNITFDNDSIEFGGSANKSISIRRDNGSIRVSSDNENTAIFAGQYNTNTNVIISANGSASFGSSNKLSFAAGIGELTVQSDASYRKVFAGKLNTAETTVINADGSATFSGNVTAPNINFKLAPATVAAMPAPLIDEGFAANEELDLLSVIIEMKLQIRDLNAFMQRSTQDNPET